MIDPGQVVSTRRRVGILGGTFDPIHVGHLALARAAQAALSLDELRLMPTGQSWQKAGRRTEASHRLRMVELALQSLPAETRLRVDDRETRRCGPTYTIDTLAELRSEQGDAALVLIMGSDQFRNLPTWHRWQELLDYAHIATTRREQVSLESLAPELEALLARHGRQSLPDEPAGAVVFFSMPAVAVSATVLRQQLAAGERPAMLLPQGVLDYIEEHSLYD